MNCQEIEKHLIDYLENECSPSLHQVVEEHVNACPNCRNELSAYKKTGLFLQLRTVPQPDKMYWELTFDKIMTATQAHVVKMPELQTGAQPNHFKNGWLKKVSIALSIAAAILVAMFGYMYQFDQPDEQFNSVISIQPEWRGMVVAQPANINASPDVDFYAISRAAIGTVDQVSRGAVVVQLEALSK